MRSSREIARISLLGASALLLGYLESMLAIPMVVPGFKLGISNVVVLVAFVLLDPRAAFSVGFVKALATGLIFGSPMMLAYSFAGTACAFAGMAVVLRVLRAGIIPAAMLSAVLHNFAQVCVAAVFLSASAVFALFPVLGFVGCATGFVTGMLAEGALRALDPRRKPASRFFAGRLPSLRHSTIPSVFISKFPFSLTFFGRKKNKSHSQERFEPWSLSSAFPLGRKNPRFFRELDPCVLVVSFFAVSAVVCIVSRTSVLVALLGVTTACIIASGIGARVVARAAMPLFPAIAFVAAFNIVLPTDGAAMSIGPLSIGEEGLVGALRILLSFACLMSASVLFSFSVSASDVVDAAGRILSPLRFVGIDVAAFALSAGMTMRFVSVLTMTYSSVARAHLSRGSSVPEGLFARVSLIVSCIAPVLAAAFRAADGLAVAMECRAYRPGSRRSSLKLRSFGVRDAVVLAAVICICGSALVFSWCTA